MSEAVAELARERVTHEQIIDRVERVEQDVEDIRRSLASLRRYVIAGIGTAVLGADPQSALGLVFDLVRLAF